MSADETYSIIVCAQGRPTSSEMIHTGDSGRMSVLTLMHIDALHTPCAEEDCKEPPPKFCRDCRHVVAPVHMVSGQVMYDRATCSNQKLTIPGQSCMFERYGKPGITTAGCGPAGTLWEPK
jgi:hypothetical protein